MAGANGRAACVREQQGNRSALVGGEAMPGMPSAGHWEAPDRYHPRVGIKHVLVVCGGIVCGCERQGVT